MRNLLVLGTAFALAGLSLGTISVAADKDKKEAKMTAYSFKMNSLEGKEVDLSKFKGKVMLAVNVASRCGYTPQYAGLQELHKKYKEKGLIVAGFPCNQFGGQEPGTSKDISSFCEKNYGVEFTMFEKDDACDLYKYLTDQEAKPKGKGPVRWNFEKFLVGKDGKVIARFGSGTSPDDKELVALIEKALGDK